nr:MAG TPA: hypothetical protein [Caudoviricetes sp.]
MTYLEYAKAHREERGIPKNIDLAITYCPDAFAEDNRKCMADTNPQFTPKEQEETCRVCWNREIPEMKPRILDSGNRRKFESGAVRDICEGKGRCDLLPMAVVARLADEPVLKCIENFQTHNGEVDLLYPALVQTYQKPLMIFPDKYTMLLEVSKHFEAGAVKYGDNNWRKGIPVHCYIDSAVRHYLKYRRGDTDEPHDRAFCWNLMCAIWTCENKPELNDYDERNARNDDQTETTEI